MHAAASNRHCPTVMLRTKALILDATIERHCAAGCGQPHNCSFAVPSDALQAICNDCVTHPAGHGADGILWTWSAAGGRINLWQCRSVRLGAPRERKNQNQILEMEFMLSTSGEGMKAKKCVEEQE